MGSQTASDILQLLAENPKSLTDIAERLAIPMTTAKYHVENLLDCGLLFIAETRYSVKGREIKIYSLTNQLLIVAPRQSNVRSLLLKYASLFGIVIFGTLALTLLSPLLSGYGGGWSTTAPQALPAPAGADRQYAGAALKATAESAAPVTASSPDAALAFFLGGVLVILVLLIYEAYLWKKR
jgi:hypothetical protein